MAFKKVEAKLPQGADFDIEAEAVRLYQTGLSALDVAKRLGQRGATVSGWLRRVGVTRSVSEAQRIKNGTNAKIAEVLRRYKQGETASRLAVRFNASVPTIYSWLRKGGCEFRQIDKFESLLPKWRRLYERGAGLDEIAEKFDVSAGVVRRHLSNAGITIRGPQEAHGVTAQQVEEWKKAYAKGHSTADIARAFGVTSSCVRANLRRQGIRVRSFSEQAGVTAEAIGEWQRLYEAGTGAGQIASTYSVSVDTVNRRLKQAGVKLRTQADRSGITPEMVAEWRRRFAAGEKVAQIAKAAGRDFGTVATRVRS